VGKPLVEQLGRHLR